MEQKLQLNHITETKFNMNFYIICQKSTNQTLTSSENDRKKIIKAAIRKGSIEKILKNTDICQLFGYHMTKRLL